MKNLFIVAIMLFSVSAFSQDQLLGQTKQYIINHHDDCYIAANKDNVLYLLKDNNYRNFFTFENGLCRGYYEEWHIGIYEQVLKAFLDAGYVAYDDEKVKEDGTTFQAFINHDTKNGVTILKNTELQLQGDYIFKYNPDKLLLIISQDK